MGKKSKLIVGMGAAFATMAIINKTISKNAEKNPLEMPKRRTYRHTFGDISYYVVETSKKISSPLLFIHSLAAGASHKEWDETMKFFSETESAETKTDSDTLKKQKIYILDLLGFGTSEKPNLTYSPYLYIESINNFINDVIKQPTGIIASSVSAAFAVMCYTFSPENFTKMLLISPTGLSEKISPDKYCSTKKFLFELPIIGTAAYNLIHSKPLLKDFIADKMYADKGTLTQQKMEDIYRSAHTNGADSKYPIASLMSGQLDINIERSFSELEIPVYLVWGRHNDENSTENINNAIALNPDIKYTIFENSKMYPPTEEPENFNEICQNFFK